MHTLIYIYIYIYTYIYTYIYIYIHIYIDNDNNTTTNNNNSHNNKNGSMTKPNDTFEGFGECTQTSVSLCLLLSPRATHEARHFIQGNN